MNYSRQRESILKIIKDSMDHPTVDYIYAEIKKEIPAISLATVYRNLNLLAEIGEIRRIETFDGATRFDYNTHNHYHFVCIKCNKVYDVPCDVAPELDSKVMELTGFKVLNHDISFQGICHECQKLNKKY